MIETTQFDLGDGWSLVCCNNSDTFICHGGEKISMEKINAILFDYLLNTLEETDD